jgi:hypothetical protein
MRRQCWLALVALLCSLNALADDNLVQNGSFEDYVQAKGSWGIYPSGRGWTTGAAGVEIRNSAVGAASDGNNFAELDTTANSSIYQDIATVVGQRYTLSFDYSNRSNTTLASNGLDWSFGSVVGSAVDSLYNSTGGNVWRSYSVVLTATSTTTRLAFKATGTSDSLGTALDKVRVSSAASQVAVSTVPEPAQTSLMLAGLACVGWLRRRQWVRRQAV